ncbi:tyrosine-type recombinase/integrase [Enterococcus faecalis]|uniref:tyrosine-type recombinase/integrase n=1 Tax=Enterococcus faecalis TaxID=1351 RepID=UPI001F50A782|nr:tyrosine-type recombinase/integrase [Enterococcus faecalis]
MAEPKKLANGKWQLRFKYKDPITNEWKNKMITRSTKKACRDAETEFKSKIMRGENTEAIKLLDFYDIWVDTFKKNKVSAGRMQKIALTRKNLNDFFGDKQLLKGVTKVKYQQWINWLAKPGNINKKGLAVETVSNRHNIVKSMFLEALDMQYIHSNPTRNIKLTGQVPEKKSNKTISIDDLTKFKEALLSRENTTSKYFILVQLYTGARYQEVAALTWDSIDESNEVIKIKNAYQYDACPSRLFPPPSSSFFLPLSFPSSLFSSFPSSSLSLPSPIFLFSFLLPPLFLFFLSHPSCPLSPSSLNTYIKETCELANIERISSHSFRHARSDLLILAEADPIYIKTQLGHKEITQSYEYASATEANRKKNKEKYENKYKDIL